MCSSPPPWSLAQSCSSIAAWHASSRSPRISEISRGGQKSKRRTPKLRHAPFRNSWAPAPLHLRYTDRSPCHLPIHAQRATAGGLVKGDREVLDSRGQRRRLHVDSRQIFGRPRVLGTPFTRFFADNQRPLVLVRNRENRVTAGRHMGPADHQISSGHESRSFIGSRPPHFAIRNQSAIDLAPLGTWARVIHGDRPPVGQRATGFRRWTRSRSFILLRRAKNRHQSQSQTSRRQNSKLFSHCFLPLILCPSIEPDLPGSCN